MFSQLLSLRRYLAAPAVAIVTLYLVTFVGWLLHWTRAGNAGILAACFVGTLAWVGIAVFDSRRTIWRLLLLWTPAFAAVAFLVIVLEYMKVDDTVGLVAAVLMVPTLLILLICLIGTVASFVIADQRALQKGS